MRMGSSKRSRTKYVAVSLVLVATVGILAIASSSIESIDSSHNNLHRHLGPVPSSSLLDEDQELPDLFPLSWPSDYLGFTCACLGLLLAAGGGIGGGGILVPIYILILEFPVKHAIPLASITVLGGAIANNLLNARKMHPNFPERPLIDWDLILQLEPMTIGGALIGADLNEMLPEIVLLVLMLLLLSVTAYKTLGKACKLYNKEEEELLQQTTQSGSSNNGKNDHDPTEDTPLVQKHLETDIEAVETLVLIDKSKRQAIKRQCTKSAISLVSVFTIITIIDLLQGTPEGTGGGPFGLQSCGTYCYWISEVLIFTGIILFSLYVRSCILKRQENGGPVLSEIHWDEHNTIVYPMYSIVAGLVAGMFGIGGGIVKGPLMLALGVHPKVASATSACMILFTSSTSTLCYYVFGFLKYDYAMFCLVLGFISTLVGQTVMSEVMKRTGQRSSYIAFCIGLVVAISAVAMGIESVIALMG